MTSTRQMARDERLDFAAFLGGLTPEQWDSPTLCDKWRVRDVAVHTVSYEGCALRALVKRFLPAGCRRIASTRSAWPTTRAGRPEQIVALIE